MKQKRVVFYVALVIASVSYNARSEDVNGMVHSPVGFNASEQIGYDFAIDTKALNGGVTPYSSCGSGSILHPGVDINKKGTSGNGDKGLPVYAIANGKVIAVVTNGWSRIVIEHAAGSAPYYSIYGHAELDPDQCRSTTNGKDQSFTRVRKNDSISIGQQIGCIWDHGTENSAHLHFEVRTSVHEGADQPAYFCNVAGKNLDWLSLRYTDPLAFIASNGYSAGNCLALNSNFGGGILCWMNPKGAGNVACINGTSHTNYAKNVKGGLSASWNLSGAAIQSYCANTVQGPVNPMLFFQNSSFLAGTRTAGDAGGGSDTFNLKINNFWIVDSSGATITGDSRSLRPGEVIQVKSQVKALNGDTSNHMRIGKTRIEVDLYAQEGSNDWVFLKREYIQATNLPSGGTHTETVSYTVPIGISQDIRFKVKIDAEDEAYEANEGDNWSNIETFQVARRTPIQRKKFLRTIMQIITTN